MPTCKCHMFKEKGICWHTGLDPDRPLTEQIPAKEEPIQPSKPNRIIPHAITRMYDFLELCEETKPGSSGLSGEW